MMCEVRMNLERWLSDKRVAFRKYQEADERAKITPESKATSDARMSLQIADDSLKQHIRFCPICNE